MLVIVSAVLGSNITLTAFAGTDDAPRGNLLVTSFTTMVLLGIVATARHPKLFETWLMTALNVLGIGLPFAALKTGNDSLIAVILALSPFFGLPMIVVGSVVLLRCCGFPRSVRYYQIASWVFWSVLVFRLLVMADAGLSFGV